MLTLGCSQIHRLQDLLLFELNMCLPLGYCLFEVLYLIEKVPNSLIRLLLVRLLSLEKTLTHQDHYYTR